MVSALDTALLLARKFDSLHRGLSAAPGGRRSGRHGSRQRADHGGGQGKRRRNGAAGGGAVPHVHERPSRAARTGEGPASLSWTWLKDAPSGHDFVGSYGRVFDMIVLARPGDEWQSPSMITLESALVRKRPAGADRAADLAALARHQHAGRLEQQHRAGAHHGGRHAASAACRAHHHSDRRRRHRRRTERRADGALAEAQRHRRRDHHDEAAGKRSAGETILAKADELGCDLIVKGAYTQSRLRQMIFGGTTRHILANAKLPVLMAH